MPIGQRRTALDLNKITHYVRDIAQLASNRVAVVGGGVVGLCIAESLARRGADVVVLERERCGSGASEGNAGWVAPSLSGPLSAPGAAGRALRWALDPSSPFLLRPVAQTAYAQWLFRFWRNTTPGRYYGGMVALVALTARAPADYDRLAASGVSFEMHRSGMLFLGLTESSLELQAHELLTQRAHGYRGAIELLGRVEAQAFEPALGDRIAGAVYTPGEYHVRPESLVAGLVEALRGRGVAIREGARVRSLARHDKEWIIGLDGGEDERAASVVVAAGVGTRTVLRSLGIDLPIEGAKGYSVTYGAATSGLARPVYMVEAKVGASPFDAGLRLAGTLELGSGHTKPSARRVALLGRAASTYLRDWAPCDAGTPWAGLRPLMPDGLPVIGPVPGSQPPADR